MLSIDEKKHRWKREIRPWDQSHGPNCKPSKRDTPFQSCGKEISRPAYVGFVGGGREEDGNGRGKRDPQGGKMGKEQLSERGSYPRLSMKKKKDECLKGGQRTARSCF